MKKIFIISLLIALGLGINGCGRGPLEEEGDTRVVARINDYELTVGDFENEADFMLKKTRLSKDPKKAKEELLNDIITKKILLQEAQKENFDKDTLFMREIERYWEQALLKLLLQRKEKELAGTVKIPDEDVLNEYNRMKHRAFAELVVLRNKLAASKLSKSGENFDAVKIEIKNSIVSGESAEWWSYGDLPAYLEKTMLLLKPGEVSRPIESGNEWIVMRVLQEEEVRVKPFEAMVPRIEKKLKKIKIEEALEKWILHLRKNASVKIDKELLNEINGESKK